MTATSTLPIPDALTGADYHALNAQLNLWGPNGEIQFERDREALEAYLEQHVLPNSPRFPNRRARLDHLVGEGYYERDVFERYSSAFVDTLFDRAHSLGFRFESFLGALKFYTTYALKTLDGRQYLEHFEDRAAVIALALGDGDEGLATAIVDEIVSGRFQLTTPTLLNTGKVRRGESISCFLLRVEDTMESVSRAVNAAVQLSKRSGGVAFSLTNIREQGAPIKGLEGQAPGVLPIMKLLEDSFSYAHQLGSRQGAGAVYLHAHHPDILRFLDTKRENADEKTRIKSLSLGVVIPDITFELAKNEDDMYLFSPYDVEQVLGVPLSEISVTEKYDELVGDERIRKSRISARGFLRTVAELQFESGYPYILFEDTANRANPIAGRITHSNLCSEILQVSTASAFEEDLSYAHVGKDITCNLGSLNIARTMDSPDFGRTVAVAIRALTAVSDQAALDCVPSLARGNDESHAIGLGQMNLHGYLARERIRYGSDAALDFTDAYFRTVAYHAIRESNRLAIERGRHFTGFPESRYASGEYFDQYTLQPWEPATERVRDLFAEAGVGLPTQRDWQELRDSVVAHGLYNQNLQAVAPNGSIAYINHATASIHPVPARIEIRKEGGVGRVCFPAPHMTNDNLEFFQDAYEIGYEKIIDTYAAATRHVDQGLSLTLFFTDDATTRDINRAHIYAWRKGIKSLYYVRLRQLALEGTEVDGVVSSTR
ncbi:class 1b ribonucleoside-diphosphate reductase subunit alpha [Streptomyces fulvoviolaceus]|uniref:class 1b ribonucleoside-diphosphate reductase subunit alpha n=1 Tax=Streptomyces fulvoviolaceus TaxID=285535 RepID=UPI0021BE94E9|nr:class 1b ribonucleoside-diphosphate reductase subunit alpha [Streptomyces fulvoviolaceus]MCT9076394.1 class 1b ribonucleoside-diphosphate reductase subunit alpha [Streptomyces fulvoviolaceus]